MNSSNAVRLCRSCGQNTQPIVELPAIPQAVQTLLRPEHVTHDRPIDAVVHTCPSCGLVQLIADFDAAQLYTGDYLYSVAFSAHAQVYQRALAERWVSNHIRAGTSLSQAREVGASVSYADTHTPSARVLEVGGGDGFFAALLEGLGCAVTLVEPAPEACRVARSRGIRRVVEGYLADDTLPGEQFDAISLRHVLEHVPGPVPFLALLRRYLRLMACC